MTTFTGIVAAVAVHSSAAALSHFGVTLAPAQMIHPPATVPAAERVVARSPRAATKLVSCPAPAARPIALHV
jgi:hypothetical protein